MIVAMMRIRIMRMLVHHQLVPMPVAVPLPGRHGLRMGMLMMGIVHMLVLVFNCIMRMLMLMPFG